MKNFKLNLLNVISLSAIICYCFFLYFGVFFENGGNFNLSIGYAATFGVIVTLLCFYSIAKKITTKNFKKNAIVELLSIVVILAFLIITKEQFTRFLFVYSSEEKIVKDVSDNISNTEVLYSDYENYCTNRVNAFSICYQKSNGISDPTKDNALKNSLLPTDYLAKKRQDSLYLKNATEFTKSFSPTNILSFQSEIKNFYKTNKNFLDSLSNRNLSGSCKQYSPFSPQESVLKDTDQYFVGKQSNNILHLVIWGILGILILLSWMVTPRHFTIGNIFVALSK